MATKPAVVKSKQVRDARDRAADSITKLTKRIDELERDILEKD